MSLGREQFEVVSVWIQQTTWPVLLPMLCFNLEVLLSR
jgi:hypothetical protein